MESGNNELRKKLRNELHQYRGSIKEVAKRRGCVPDWVRKVLVYEWNDDRVLALCIEVLNERREQRKKAQQLITKALKA